ncbi:MAG: alpha/beta hydrolase [Lacisediminihabitans sp.]
MREPDIRRTNTAVDGPRGPVAIRIYHPENANGTGIVWLHGGAFYLGDLDVPEADWVSQRFAEAGITVVSVDYRLANDGIHYPIPGDDCLAAWRWATEHSDLGVRAGFWHIGGGSAGGNLAASVSMQARDGLAKLPRTTVLVYPVLHSELPTPSDELAAKIANIPEERRFPPDESAKINLNYVGDPELLLEPYAFPSYGHQQGLPPTLIINADSDDLRSSGEAYGAQLVAAGVDTVVVREVGVYHGHLNEPETPGAQKTVRRMIDWLVGSELVGEPHEGLHAATR